MRTTSSMPTLFGKRTGQSFTWQRSQALLCVHTALVLVLLLLLPGTATSTPAMLLLIQLVLPKRSSNRHVGMAIIGRDAAIIRAGVLLPNAQEY
eukprot:gene8790-1165_t